MSSKRKGGRSTSIARVNAKAYPWLVPLLGVGALAGTASVAVNGWFAVAGVVLALVAALSQILQNGWVAKEAERRLAEAEARAFAGYNEAVDRHTLLADQLDPIARTIAQMPDLGHIERDDVFQRIAVQAVNSVMLAIPSVRGLRAVIYEVTADGQNMQVVHWNARTHRPPPTPFVRGTKRGDAAFDLLVSGESLFVADITSAPDRWAGSGNGYNTFISCPITSPSSSYGLLTVDAENTDDLTEEDVADIRLLAGILTGAFAERVREP